MTARIHQPWRSTAGPHRGLRRAQRFGSGHIRVPVGHGGVAVAGRGPPSTVPMRRRALSFLYFFSFFFLVGVRARAELDENIFLPIVFLFPSQQPPRQAPMFLGHSHKLSKIPCLVLVLGETCVLVKSFAYLWQLTNRQCERHYGKPVQQRFLFAYSFGKPRRYELVHGALVFFNVNLPIRGTCTDT